MNPSIRTSLKSVQSPVVRTPLAMGSLILAALFALPCVTSCAGAIPPFDTPYEEFRGFKARTFVGTADDLRPMVISTLQDLGYEVHSEGDDKTFVVATRGMGAQDSELEGSRREWVRVGVEVRQVDMHRRAPRTLVEVEAENVQGTSDGPINASFGSVPSEFYSSFFDQVEARVREATPHRVRGFLPPA